VNTAWLVEWTISVVVPGQKRPEGLRQGQGWKRECQWVPVWYTCNPSDEEICSGQNTLWTQDAMRALRFCRQEDAENFRRRHCSDWGTKVTEHGFDDEVKP
jgi:hypothetical protein